MVPPVLAGGFASMLMPTPSQLAPPRRQSAAIAKDSPITPPGEIPGLLIAPVAVLTNGLPVVGSVFGMIKGFTQRGCTGIMLAATLPEFEELNTSAVAVALAVVLEKLPFGNNLKMRAKKIGSFPLVTVTLTTGFTPKAAPAPVQLVLVAPALPPPYCTDTLALVAATPLIRFC